MNPLHFARPFLHSAVMAAVVCAFAGAVHAQPAGASAASSSAASARPAVGAPLMEAEKLIKDGRFAEALAKAREAEKAGTDATPYEAYVIHRMKAVAAFGAGDAASGLVSTEAAIDTRYLQGKQQLDLIESLVHAAYNAKDYARVVPWAKRYAEAGGTQPDVGALRLQALYLNGDYAAAAEGLQNRLAADDAAGRVTTERQLQLLAVAQSKLNDDAGHVRTTERLVRQYPTPAYWSVLLSRVDQQKLATRQLLDLMRLMRATGVLRETEQYMTMANMALLAGLPAQAVSALDEGYANGKLGQGAKAAEHSALRDKARKQAADDLAQRAAEDKAARAARDGNGLVGLGQVLVAEGKLDAGITLIEQGIAKGGLRQPEEARLHLGIAQALAGRGDSARQTLSTTQGPLAELARLWSLYASSPRVATAAPDAPVAAAKM